MKEKRLILTMPTLVYPFLWAIFNLQTCAGDVCVQSNVVNTSSCCAAPGTCYVVNNEPQDWHSANTHCEKLGGSLAEITRDEDHLLTSRLLSSLGAQSAWIGARLPSKSWHWTNAVELDKTSYTNWALGQPDNRGDIEACAIVDSRQNYTWFDEICAIPFTFICQLPISQSQCSGLGHASAFINNTCFVSPNGLFKSWFEARIWCFQFNGDLVVVHNPDVERNIISLVGNDDKKRHSWIGLTRSYWRWTNGKSVVYTRWKMNENGSGKNSECVALQETVHAEGDSTEYFWVADSCQTKRVSVCQVLGVAVCTLENTYSCNKTDIFTTVHSATRSEDTIFSRPATTRHLTRTTTVNSNGTEVTGTVTVESMPANRESTSVPNTTLNTTLSTMIPTTMPGTRRQLSFLEENGLYIGISVAISFLFGTIVGLSCHCTRKRRKRKMYMRRLEPGLHLYDYKEMEKKYFSRALSDTVSEKSSNSPNGTCSRGCVGKQTKDKHKEGIINAYGTDMKLNESKTSSDQPRSDNRNNKKPRPHSWELYTVDLQGNPTWNWKLSSGNKLSRNSNKCLL